ncbi:MAG: hypothetical protein LWY06_03060 [Firmicutes bacterium]|nr:hypothetical protein [Bacillota bacterium]
MSIFQKMIIDMNEWCRGRNGWIRIPFIIFFVWVFVKHMQNPEYKSIIGALNLGIHELGHFIFAPFGEMLNVLGGTITQLAAPVLAMVNFIRQRDYFAIALCFGWLSTNFFEVATYAGDAKEQMLPLVGPGTEYPMHDWNFILKKFNMVNQCGDVANVFRFCAIIAMTACMFMGIYIIVKMLTTKRDPDEPMDFSRV